jgi:methyltransferase NSUN6
MHPNPCSLSLSLQLLSESQVDKDGLLAVRQFPPESFDRIVLDPPCSALGLRPKLAVELSYRAFQSFASHQRKLVAVAIQLLKPGGILAYSTCTINHEENEQLVRHVLDLYGNSIELERIDVPLGGFGLAGVGLDEFERSCVRRFDPADDPADSIGFFLAKFRKRI